MPEGVVDAVVVGGGAAGLNGALVLARSRRSVVVVDGGSPRNAPADAVHGFIVLDGTPPADVYRRGREQVRERGGRVVHADVVSAEPSAPSAGGDPRFTVTLDDGRSITARRLLVATGVADVLPDVPGLARHWGHSVIHCPYCHGWEVRDQAIGILAVGAPSVTHALLFRQLSDDVTYFVQGSDLDEVTRARFAARGIRVVDTPVTEVVDAVGGTLAGVRLADGRVVARSVITVGTQTRARTRGLEGLGLPMQDLPAFRSRVFADGAAGATEVPGVWVAGNATDPAALVGSSAAAGAAAAAAMSVALAAADADAAVRETAGATA